MTIATIGGKIIEATLTRSWARRIGTHPLWMSAAIAFVAVLVPMLYIVRLTQAPDFIGDEALYAIAARSIADHGDIAWGTPVFVHPPGFFLVGAAWLKLFASSGSGVLSDIYILRSLTALLSCLVAALAGALAAALAPPRAQRLCCMATTVLVAFNPISIRFGRMVLIEPMALALSLAVVLLAWHLRSKSTTRYVLTVGLVGGAALLTKSVTIFIIVTPLLVALLAKLPARLRVSTAARPIHRELGALAVAAVIWMAFPIWAVANGTTLGFLSEQTISIRRLLGLLQLSGLNRPGVSATASLLGTLGQYAGAYVLLLAGGLGLVVASLQRRPWSERSVYLMSYATLAFAALAYNVLLGQSNEQLFYYAFPAAALASVTAIVSVATGRVTMLARGGIALLVAVALALSAYSWVLYELVTPDNGTVATRDVLANDVPACALVNASGDHFRWGYVVRSNPVTAYDSGPDALVAGVHVFILSTKDSQFLYGNSNPQLDAWVRGAGTRIADFSTHTYGDLSVWTVGAVPAPDNRPDCAMPVPGAVPDANAAPFLIALPAMVVLAVGLVLAVAFLVRLWVRLWPRFWPRLSVRLLVRLWPRRAGPATNSTTQEPDLSAKPAAKPVRAAWLSAAIALSAVVNYAYTLLLTHGLSPAQYAIFAAGQGILVILGTVGAVAVPWVLAREVVLQAGHPDRVRAAVNLAFWINTFGGAALAVGLGAVTLTFGSFATALVMTATTFLLAVGSTSLGYLQGTQNVGVLGGLVLGEFVVKLIAGVVLVFGFRLGGTAALFAATIGALVPLVGCVIVCGRAIGRPRRVRLSPGLWHAAARIGGLQSIVAVFTALDTVLVAALASTHADAGPYQAAATLGRTPFYVSVALATVVFPVLTAHRGSITHRADALRTLMVANVFVLLALTTVPPRVVALVFPEAFVSLLRWLPILALLGVGLATLNLMVAFVQTEDTTVSARVRLICGFVAHIVLLLVGAKTFGATGLAWGAVIGVWITVGLLATLPLERKAVPVALRQLAKPVNGFVLAVVAACLVVIHQPVLWLACAAVGGLAAAAVAFPELTRRRPPAVAVPAERESTS